jgi:outer membrane protein
MIRFALSFLLFAMVAAPGAPAAEKKPGRRVLELTLPKAIRFAVAKNFSIQAERFSPRAAKERVRSAWGRFDPELDITYQHGDSTVRSQLTRDPLTGEVGRFGVGTNAQDDTLSVGVSGVTVWGLGYDVGASTRRIGASGLGGEQYTSELSFGLTQPLLRGAGTEVNLAGVRVARNNVSISEWGLKDRVMDVITNVIVVYNELHFTQENLGVATRSQSLARRLLQDNIKRVEAGVMTPLDVTTAQAEVAAREEAVLRAERDMKDQENFLKQLVTDDLLPLLGTRVEITPPKAPAFFSAVIAGVKEALELRPDYRQAKLDIQNRSITVAVEKNSLLPRLDLNASLSLLGVDDDTGTSLSRAGTGRDRNAWNAGAIFSLPLGNQAARGRYNAATLEAAQALVRLQQLEQNIIVLVDNANGAVVTSRERIEANSESSRLAKESLDAGEKRLVAGTGTVFEVLELQNNLAEAETAELRARADYNKAIARYQQQTGTTLRVHGVRIE